jgi:hypothetical protein
MDRRFGLPTTAELATCNVPPELSATLPKRFRELADPFGDLLESDTDRYYFHAVLEGLAADNFTGTPRKNESIAYAHDSDRQMYQVFVGQKDWDHQPMLNLLAKQVGEKIGDKNAVIAPKKQLGIRHRFLKKVRKVSASHGNGAEDSEKSKIVKSPFV